VKDFSRARIEEYFALSHPKKVYSFPVCRCKEPVGLNCAHFCSANKLDAHFDRVREGGSDIFISYEVGSLQNSLYEKDYDFASDDLEVRCISALELDEVDSSDSDENCDESNNVH
jgi:hypothetical protein